MANQKATECLHSATKDAISREQARRDNIRIQEESSAAQNWKHAAGLAARWSRSLAHYRDQINVTAIEDMSDVDCFDGEQARSGKTTAIRREDGTDEDLITVSPVVDGRLRDVSRN